MERCIFCPNELDKYTALEHILPNALGGRKTTRKAICSDCNNKFGSSIDKSLTSQVEIIRNLLQLQSGSGKKPPMLRNIQSGENTVHFRNDGTPELVDKPFTEEPQDDGTTVVSVKARSEEELRKVIPHIAAKFGLSIEEVKDRIEASNASVISQPIDRVHHRIVFGGEEALRSITKSCLVLWSSLVGSEELRSSAYDDAREFVITGNAHFNDSRIQLDSRHLPIEEGLTSQFGDIFNLLYLRSNSAGRLVGHFTMFNAVSWQIILADSGAVPDLCIGLVSNPFRPEDWSDAIANELEIDFDWLNSPTFNDFQRAQERLNTIIGLYVERARSSEISRIVDGVCNRRGLSEDDPIPSEILDEMVNEISDQSAHFALRLRHERPLTPSEIRAILTRE